MDILAAGTVIAGRRQLQRAAAAFQLDDVLHAPFAPGPLADDRRPFVILQTGTDNLTGRGAKTVDQHRHGESGKRALLLRGPDTFLTVASLGAHDLAFVDEQVGNRGRLRQQSARVGPQIQDQDLHACGLETFQGGLHLIDASPAEMCQADVSNLLLVVEHEVRFAVLVVLIAQHGGYLNDGAHDLDLLDLVRTDVLNADRHGFARLALQKLHRLRQFESFRRLPLDFHDHVAGTNTGFVSGRSRKRRNDRQTLHPRWAGHLNSNAAELLLDRLGETRDVLGTDVRRILIERVQHPANGRLHQLAAIHVFHVVPVDLLERVDEDLHQLVIVCILLVGLLLRDQGRRDNQQAQDADNHPDQTPLQSGMHHESPSNISISPATGLSLGDSCVASKIRFPCRSSGVVKSTLALGIIGTEWPTRKA